METTKIDNRTREKPKELFGDTSEITSGILHSLHSMIGSDESDFPEKNEILLRLETQDIHSIIELEYFFKFLKVFLFRTAHLIKNTIYYHLDYKSYKKTIVFFIETIGKELDKINHSYCSCEFETLLNTYLMNLKEGKLL